MGKVVSRSDGRHDMTYLTSSSTTSASHFVVHPQPERVTLKESANRSLPHDVEAERLLVSAMLVANPEDREPYLSALRPDDCISDFHRLIIVLLRTQQDVPTTMVQRKGFIRDRCGVDNPPYELARLFIREDGSPQCGLVNGAHQNLRGYFQRVKEVAGCRQRILDAEQELAFAWMESHDTRYR